VCGALIQPKTTAARFRIQLHQQQRMLPDGSRHQAIARSADTRSRRRSRTASPLDLEPVRWRVPGRTIPPIDIDKFRRSDTHFPSNYPYCRPPHIVIVLLAASTAEHHNPVRQAHVHQFKGRWDGQVKDGTTPVVTTDRRWWR
jgi:hypothetical protein